MKKIEENINEFAQEALIVADELNDQEDYIKAMIDKIEEIYKLENPGIFQYGFHVGELYRLLLQFKLDSKRLSTEIIQLLTETLKKDTTP